MELQDMKRKVYTEIYKREDATRREPYGKEGEALKQIERECVEGKHPRMIKERHLRGKT